MSDSPASLVALVMAAGKGTRMKSALPKVLHAIAGEPLLGHVLATLAQAEVDRTIVIVGHGAEQVRAFLAPSIESVEQTEQLGTAHAVMQAAPALTDFRGDVLILSGDVPLLSPQTISKMLEAHLDQGSALTVLTFTPADPGRYGRIVRDASRRLKGIVEYKDASDAQRSIKEVNAGVYVASWPVLATALQEIGNANAQGEYYLPDAVSVLLSTGLTVNCYHTDDPTEVAGVNTRAELVELAEQYQARTARRWLEAGITLESPGTTWIGPWAELGEDVVLEPGVQVYGRSRIASGARIGAHSRLVNAIVGEGAEIWQSYILDSEVGPGTTVGPFAHLRGHARLGARCRIGNFVEIKGSTFGDGAKASHLSYIGDATVGQKANLGAGTITCNYDGTKKHRTNIGERTFIGSNNTLVAPLTVGSDAYTAAGSTITEDVPDGALALGRARQVTKDGWALSRKGSHA